ncbi:MAG: radical SAM protein [Chloroflexaceae bacterium]|nr:radical SAM protein [Chloroflexaceae bacterium]NJO05109.1 radical SAM protein [Chloroflexaceae bacterium]
MTYGGTQQRPSETDRSLPREILEHPCYSADAHHKYGRIHVPVAPRCNIQCNYCTRKFACPNENRPGVTMRVISATEAIDTIEDALRKEPRLRVLGVAGPGDALANDATLDTFRRARSAFPMLSRCLSTNGLLLPEKIDEIHDAGITSLTITINAIDPAVGMQIYSRIRYKQQTYRGAEAFDILCRNQLDGLERATERGMFVKVNSVLIPGINDRHLIDVAREVKRRGAYTMNIIPMIPLAQFAHMEPPTDEEVNRVRDECETVIRQFRNCMRCRADAIGVPGEEGCGGPGPANGTACNGRKTGDGKGCDPPSGPNAGIHQVCTPKFLEGKAVIALTGLDLPQSTD